MRSWKCTDCPDLAASCSRRADEKQSEASKNGYRVSRNRASDFNGLHECILIKDQAILSDLSHKMRLNQSTRWFILGVLEQLTRQIISPYEVFKEK